MTAPASRLQPSSTAPPDIGVAFDRHLLGLLAGGDSGRDSEASDSPGSVRAASYRRFLDALGVALYTTDAAGRITFFNTAAAEFWGRRPVLGEAWCGSLRLLWPDQTPMAHGECPMAVALTEQRPVRGAEAVAVRPDGSTVRFLAYPTPLFNPLGRLLGAVNVLVDVSERHRAEEASRAAMRALAASDAVKDEFLGLVSHELRTPVTTIFGNARLLQLRGAELADAVKASMIADIEADADRLHAIIENLLHLTRLESGTLLELEPQVLGHVIDRFARSYQARRPNRRIRVVGTASSVVEADSTYLALLLENLLGNADRYSPPGRPILIRVAEVGDEAVVAILDRGIGLGATSPEALFEPFYRSPEARSTAGGLGIGLALCQRIVQALGGRIWAKRRSGGGAEFGFAIPIPAVVVDAG